MSSGRKKKDHASANCQAIMESNGKLTTANISFTFEAGPWTSDEYCVPPTSTVGFSPSSRRFFYGFSSGFSPF